MNKKMIFLIGGMWVIAILASLTVWFWFSGILGVGGYEKAKLIINGEEFKVEIAKTKPQKVRGLSHRETIGRNEGMLFVYGSYQREGIWMKDMNFAIDIIWIKDGRVAGVEKEVPPESYKEGKVFYPPEMIDMILEVRAGTVERVGIKEGDEVMKF